ncbi:hypothetical protein [Pseudoalteromonas sp. McH1-7]|uniref:hypothetical protein n=1 Tax=Pseudoalteromonas sp. McH1-7 TaxID=2745574 RepID=UPI0020CA3F82|nr:hypothetical protein [Pseudoalteromonas sp. McH1-7]
MLSNAAEVLIELSVLDLPECVLFIVAQLLLRLLGGKSSAVNKTHSEEQKSNSKGQQTPNKLILLVTNLVFSWISKQHTRTILILDAGN